MALVAFLLEGDHFSFMRTTRNMNDSLSDALDKSLAFAGLARVLYRHTSTLTLVASLFGLDCPSLEVDKAFSSTRPTLGRSCSFLTARAFAVAAHVKFSVLQFVLGALHRVEQVHFEISRDVFSFGFSSYCNLLCSNSEPK